MPAEVKLYLKTKFASDANAYNLRNSLPVLGNETSRLHYEAVATQATDTQNETEARNLMS